MSTPETRGNDHANHTVGSTLLGAALLLLGVSERVLSAGAARTATLLLAVLSFVIACALRVRALVHAKGDVRGVETRVLGCYAGVLSALLLYGWSTDAVLRALGLSDAAHSHLVAVLSVLWPSLMLVSLCTLFFIELAYARMPIAAAVELRRVRSAAHAGLTLGFSAVFLLSINYVATARDVRRDVSYFKTTEPSAATERLLKKLDAPLTAILFWRKTDDVAQEVEPYFAALQRRTSKLHYEVLDAALAPELCRKHRVSGNGSVLLLLGEGDKQKGQSFKIGSELLEARAQLKKLDGSFQQAFAKLARPERSVKLTVGHAERNAKSDETGSNDPDQRANSTLVMEDIFKRLNLKSDDLGMAQGLGGAVPDGSGAVIVAGPRDKFLPEESQALLDYVRKGGRLLLMVDPGVDDGLDPLLAGLGLMREPGVLESDKNHMQRRHELSDKAIVFSNSYSSHPTVTTASHYQSEVATIFVNGVSIAKTPSPAADKADQADKQPKPSVTFPLRSAGDFYRDLDGDFERDANEPQGSYNLLAAVTLIGQPSAPEGRAVVIGDGDFMTDKVASNNGNMMVFVDSLAWLIGNEELSSEVSSEEDVPLEHSRDRDKLWFYATTFAVPMPVLGLGFWVSRRRRRGGASS